MSTRLLGVIQLVVELVLFAALAIGLAATSIHPF